MAVIQLALTDQLPDVVAKQNSNNNFLNTAKAPLVSPALTGSPTAPTQSANDNSIKIATTAYVDRSRSITEVLLGTGTISIIAVKDTLYYQNASNVTVVGSVDISGLNSGDHFYFALKTGVGVASITLSTTMSAGSVFVPGDVNYVMSVANKTSNAIIEYIKVGTEARMVL